MVACVDGGAIGVFSLLTAPMWSLTPCKTTNFMILGGITAGAGAPFPPLAIKPPCSNSFPIIVAWQVSIGLSDEYPSELKSFRRSLSVLACHKISAKDGHR